jgi:hypothetical protein
MGNAIADVIILGSIGASLSVLTSNGAGANPSWQITGTGTVTHTAGNLTQYFVACGNGTADLTVIASIGSAGQALVSNGAGAFPSFQTVAGTGTVTHTVGSLAVSQIVVGNAAADCAVIGSLGTTSTVLVGNAGGNPAWGTVSLTSMVTGALPPSNGGTGIANNNASTFTISGNFPITVTVSATSALTLPTSGTVTAQGNSVTGSGNIVLATTPTITTPVLTTPTVNGYIEEYYVPASSSTFAISLTNGTMQQLATAANMTATLPTPVAGKSFTIQVAYGGVHTVTWAIASGTLKWANGGTAPPATSVNGKFDTYVFASYDTTNLFGYDGGRNS